MEYYRNVEDGTVKAVEHGSDAEKTLLAQKTTASGRTSQTFPLYEAVTSPGAPAADISGVPDWAADRFSTGALVKHGGKLYIAKGDVAAGAAAPDTNTTDWDLIGPGSGSGGSEPGYIERVLADGPVAYWPLDDPVGSVVARELAGAGHTGIPSGTVTFGNAAIAAGLGTSLAFGAYTGKVVIPAGAALLKGYLTMEFWTTPDAAHFPEVTVDENFLITADDDSYIELYTAANGGNLSFGLENNGANYKYTDSPSDFDRAGMRHVVATWDAAKGIVYVNGTELFRRDPPDHAGVFVATPGDLWIGGSQFGTDGAIHGRMSNVALYAYPLSAAQVAAHYAAGVAA